MQNLLVQRSSGAPGKRQLNGAARLPRLQTAGEVVPLVAALVELERKVYHSREVIEGKQSCAVPPASVS